MGIETINNLEPRKRRDVTIPSGEAIHGDIEVSIAGPEDIEAAKELIFREYEKEGYVVEFEEDGKGEHVKPGHGHETPISSYLDRAGSITFVAKKDNEVIGTVSMVFGEDSQGNTETLPMEELYKEEIKKYRDKGDKIAEVTQLALKRKESPTLRDFINQRSILVKLYVLILKKSFEKNSRKELNDLVIAINPEQEDFYKDTLKFEHLGGVKTYGSVNNKEAIAKIFKLEGKNEAELLDILYSLVKPRPH